MTGAATDGAELAIAVVVLAPRATPSDRDLVAGIVESANGFAAYTVVVVPKGWRAPPRSRVAHVSPGASPIAAIRAGMAQLSNTPARYALLWPLEAGAVDPARLRALVAAVGRERPALATFAGEDVERAPVMVARDAWLDLMTLGEQGIGAVAGRHGVHRVAGDAT
jgi:molybdopterin-guanine dinucleotide biosynthesis protein A